MKIESILSIQIFELRFEPDPKILDVIGKIAEELKNKCGFKHWDISKDRVDLLLDEKGTEKGFVSYKNCGYVSQFPPTVNHFEEKSGKFLKALFDLADFKPKNYLRLGVRSHFGIPYEGDFESLKNKYISGFIGENNENMKKIFDGEIINVGLYTSFQADNEFFNVLCNLYMEEQFKVTFPKEILPEGKEIPKFGIFLDVDYFTKALEGKRLADLVGTIKAYSNKSWSMSKSMVKTIME